MAKAAVVRRRCIACAAAGVFIAVSVAWPAAAAPAPGELLAEEFAGDGALARWQAMDGARVADAPVSRATIDGEALRFDVDPSMKRWLALVRTVPLDAESARWLRISVRMRTRDVDAAGAPFANSNVFFRFGAGPVLGLRPLTGTHEWTAIARRVEVPAGAAELTVGCFLSLPGTAWFDDVRVETCDAPAWREERDGAYRYFLLPGDAIDAQAKSFNRESLRQACAFLEVEAPSEVAYFKYPDLAVKAELTGVLGNGHAANGVIHSIWPRDRHEIVHLLTPPWGDPPALLGEGIAVHLSGAWQGEPVRSFARTLRDGGEWIALADLLDTRALRRHDDRKTYAIAGAFVEWVVEEYGKETLRALYGALENRAATDVNAAAFARVLGLTLADADDALRAWL